MSLAVVSAEAAPVCPLPSTVEGSSQLLTKPTPQAHQVVGRLALVAELPTAPCRSNEELDTMRIIDNERHQREQALHSVIDSLTRIIAKMKGSARDDQPPITITHGEITYSVHYFYERCLDCRDCGHGFNQDLLAQEQHGFTYGSERHPAQARQSATSKSSLSSLAHMAQADTCAAFSNSYIAQLPTDIEPLRGRESDDPIGTEYNQYGYRVSPPETNTTTYIGTTQANTSHQPTLSAA